MTEASPIEAVAHVPAGAWCVGVSGGADSVALLHLLHTRSDLKPVVAHLNHQTRSQESDDDEAFVRALCEKLNIACVAARRDALEASLDPSMLPKNPSALFRRLRFEHFARVVESHSLSGVVLAHHADDQAETVMLRLLRGAGYSALAGVRARTTIRGVLVLRPLLAIRRAVLRDYLREKRIDWREDSSNASQKYAQNRVRIAMRAHPELTEPLLALADACAAMKRWADEYAPELPPKFAAATLDKAPSILARRSATRWLAAHGCALDSLDRAVVDRLLAMCRDAATPARRIFPGNVVLRRNAGFISPA